MNNLIIKATHVICSCTKVEGKFVKLNSKNLNVVQLCPETVTVIITDVCMTIRCLILHAPCFLFINFCCEDQDHFDLSVVLTDYPSYNPHFPMDQGRNFDFRGGGGGHS